MGTWQQSSGAAMSACIRIYISAPRYGEREPVYTARLGSPTGPIIVESSGEPLLAASRAVLALGHVGRIEMWDAVLPTYRMYGDIEKLAQLTIRNGRYEKYRPTPGKGVRSANHPPMPLHGENSDVAVPDPVPGTRKGNR